MNPCSPLQGKIENKNVGNHDGSVVDVTLLHIVAVLPPFLLLGREGSSVQIYKMPAPFVSSIKHR